MESIRGTTLALESVLREIATVNCGFISAEQVAELAKLDRLRQLLVRCNGCRFVAAAQDVQYLITLVETGCNGTEWVRDVSLLAGDSAMSGDYRPHTVDGHYCKPQPVTAIGDKPLAAPIGSKRLARYIGHDGDYGGAVDCMGNVSSDADSGL